jgi:hypothetical protein
MYQNTRHAAVSSVRIHVTVTDLTGVQRVLTLLNGRNYSLTRFEAEEAGGGRWRLRIESTTVTPGQVELLEARLQRVPDTLLVDVQCSGVSPVVHSGTAGSRVA